MDPLVSHLLVRRFSRPELAELARWESLSSRHGWSVGDDGMSVERDVDGVEFVPLYLAAVSGGPVYFVKPGLGGWSLVDGRGQTMRFATLRAALEFACPTTGYRPLTADRPRPGAVVVHLPTAASRLTVVR